MNRATPSHPTAGASARREARRNSIPGSALLTALFAAVAIAAPARAGLDEAVARPQVWRGLETWAEGTLVDVKLEVDGATAPLYFAPGRFDRRYLQAFAGRNYSIVLRNNTGNRIAVLLAVDGLNAVNGEITSLRSSEPMYVLDAWQTATIPGWRTSLDEVRRFVFVDEKRSYAERTGQSNSDMGWIRVLAFREQPKLQAFMPRWGSMKSLYRDGGPSAPRAEAPQSAPEARAPQATEELAPAPTRARSAVPEAQDHLARGEAPQGSFPGTGWGERRTDRVQRVEFKPDPVAVDHLIFRYEYASGLRALGIVPMGERWRDRLGERDGDMGFARPPRR
jgi:hypothetical protein